MNDKTLKDGMFYPANSDTTHSAAPMSESVKAAFIKKLQDGIRPE